ncbi:taste receptor type 2 member 9-like [Ambystoma mexicanum]|uniref:taste receptor type 2 member 9-like n=1 Tax=Ambystoma mexicanum TaxID=8296 RepID=UPI0037E8AD17
MELLYIKEYMITISILNAIGILNSAFIVAVNVMDLTNGRALKSCDLMLLAVGISFAFCQCFRLSQSFLSYVLEDFQAMMYMLRASFLLHLWSGRSSIWFTACLSVFYCVKIVDFNHHLFFWLKLKISRLVPWMLLCSVAQSFVLTIPLFWYSCEESFQNSSTNLSSCTTVPGTQLRYRKSHFIANSVLGVSLPLLLGIAAISLILISLCRHTKRMRKNASGFCQPRLDAHLGAAKMVGSLLLTYISALVAECTALWTNSSLLIFICWIALAAIIPAQSIILILGNTKLNKVFRTFFLTHQN